MTPLQLELHHLKTPHLLVVVAAAAVVVAAVAVVVVVADVVAVDDGDRVLAGDCTVAGLV